MDVPLKSLPVQHRGRHVGLLLLAGVLLWAGVVVALAATGVLQILVGPQFALLVALGIAVPTALYFAVPAVQRTVQGWGIYPLSLWHLWRAPAALLFFWYGAQDLLPPVFWIVAGTGDLLVALYALRLLRGRADAVYYRRLHRFGLADFVIAVGLGLTYTLLGDLRMQTLATLPMALIPLFGVGLSGASHLIALSMLGRRS